MYYIAYKSNAATSMSDQELVELLMKSRNNNIRLNVTGLLIYHNGSFIQVVEGEQSVLEALIDTIAADERHTKFKIIGQGNIPERFFSHWAMGFCSADADVLKIIKGYINPLTQNITELNPQSENNEIIALLKQFVEINQGHIL